MEKPPLLCISCKKRPIFNKKRGFCKPCVTRFYYATSPSYKQPSHTREMDFVRTFFNNKNWSYHPAIFRLDGERYEPDFYDKERNVFIEVAGTKQAFSRNKEKYKRFIECFPGLKLEIRHTNGDLIDLNGKFDGK